MRGLPQYLMYMQRQGCISRPFYQICVTTQRGRKWVGSSIEQVGTFDPLPNERDEKLVGLNIERIKYWLAKDAKMSVPVMELLGLSGLLPIHPLTFKRAKDVPKVREMLERARTELENADEEVKPNLNKWKAKQLGMWRYKC